MADEIDELNAAIERRKAAAAQAAQVTPGQAGRVGDLHARYGLGSAAVPLGVMGANDQTARRVAEAKVRRDRARPRVGQETTGGVFGAIGRAVGAVSGAVGDVVGDGGYFFAATKPLVRYGAAATMFTPEIVQAGVRTALSDDYNPMTTDAGDFLAQTTLGAGVQAAAEDGHLGRALVDAVGPGNTDEKYGGSGWFIGENTPTGRRQVAAARRAQLVDGHAGTLGRNIATHLPVEPGSVPYNIVSGLFDAGVYLADPSAKLGGRIGAANRARRVVDAGRMVEVDLPQKVAKTGEITPVMRAGEGGTERVFAAETVGLVDGVRKTVLPERFAAWLNHEKGGNRLAQELADTKDFNTIWRGIGKKLPVDLVTRLVDADDPITVKNVLVDAVQSGAMRETLEFKAKRPPARLASMMPPDSIDLEDADVAVEGLDRMLRNARIPEQRISQLNEQMARAASKGERYQVVKTALKGFKESLVAHGMKEREANDVVRMFSTSREGNRLYNVGLIADDATVRSVRIAGTDHEIAGPHLTVEFLDRHLPLPSARDMKVAARKYEWVRELQQSKKYKLGRDFADFYTQSLFKPLALVTRLAYPVRVIGEEQARIAAAGYASVFKHPLSYLAYVAGEKPTVPVTVTEDVSERAAREVGAVDTPGLLHAAASKVKRAPNLGGDAVGGRFEEPDLVRGISEWQQAMSKEGGGWVERTRRLAPRHRVPVKPDEPEFVDGWLDELITLASDPVSREAARGGAQRVKDMFWDGALQGERRKLAGELRDTQGRPINLDDRRIADAYIDTVLERNRKFHLDHPELVSAVAHGKLAGHPLAVELIPSAQGKHFLTGLLDQGIHPKVVRGNVIDNAATTTGQQAIQHYEDAVQEGFRMLMSIPTNRLSRSPVFKQAYWERMTELVPLLKGSDRAALIRNAKDAGVPRRVIKQMRAAQRDQTLSGPLALENADMVAKHHALGATRELLYSLHEKAQIADALRVTHPFFEAWREVLTRWAKLATTNPAVGYRGLQAIPMAERAGFFYPDPVTGQEMFGIPGSEWLTEKFTGVPVQLEAPVSGLNMFGNIAPGSGPLLSITASKMLPDNPGLDGVRSMILPFGDPDTSGGLIETLFPSWARKVFTGAGLEGWDANKRQLAATTRDVQAYLASTGKYDLSTPDGQKRLLDDAENKARAIYVIRGFAQSTWPAPPVARFFTEDKSGRLRLMWELQNDYGKFLDENPETATDRLIDKWGDLAFLGAIGDTTGPNAPTDRLNEFARAHPDQADKFPTVLGFFAPGGEIDPAEIQRQVDTGSREPVSPEEAQRLYNIRIATHLYERAKKRYAGDEQALWAVQDELIRRYRGYTGMPGDLSRTPAAVQELVRAVQDPVLAATDAGKGLALYLEAREQAQTIARQAGLKSFQRAKAAAPLRQWLRDYAAWAVSKHPEFQDMWDRVLSNEVEEATQ